MRREACGVWRGAWGMGYDALEEYVMSDSIYYSGMQMQTGRRFVCKLGQNVPLRYENGPGRRAAVSIPSAALRSELQAVQLPPSWLVAALRTISSRLITRFECCLFIIILGEFSTSQRLFIFGVLNYS